MSTVVYEANVDQITRHFPKELQEVRTWVLWRGKDRVGEVKLNKIPIDPQTLGNGSHSDPTTWGTFERCCQAAPVALEEWAADRDTYRGGGIGFVFTPEDPYAGVDLDDCRDPESGKLEPWARQLVTILHSYTEVSPSGKGVKVWTRGLLPGNGRKRGEIELYDQKRFFTVTGNHLEGTPTTIEERQDVINRLYIAIPIMAKALEHYEERFSRLFAGDIRDYDDDDSRADMGLCSLAVQVEGTPEQIDALMRMSGLYRSKWDESRGEQTYGQMTITQALEGTGRTPQRGQARTRLQTQSARVIVAKRLPSARWVVPSAAGRKYRSFRYGVVSAHRSI